MSWQFVVSMPRPRELTVVERNPENLYVERAQALGVHVLIGDVLDTNVLRKVNLHTARHLVTFSGNDGTNVELAIKARNYMSTDPTSRQLRVHLHINDTRISAQLEEYAKFFDDSSAASIDFFSVYDLNARILMHEYPPERFAEVFGQDEVHIENTKINPFAVRWGEMSDAQREEEIDAVRDLPRLLWESMGIGLRREYLIGVTGHRPHRLGDSAGSRTRSSKPWRRCSPNMRTSEWC